MKIVLISENESTQSKFVSECADVDRLKNIDTTLVTYQIDIDVVNGKLIQLCVVKWYNCDSETLARIYLKNTKAVILLDLPKNTDYSWVQRSTLLPCEDFFTYSFSSIITPYEYLHDVYAAKIAREQTKPSYLNSLFRTASERECNNEKTIIRESVNNPFINVKNC